MATNVDLRYVTPDEFLRINFGSDLKAELDNGVIRMMSGGSLEHARVQMNLYRWLGSALRGSGCRPYGSDAAVRTTSWSVRYPDVTIDCAPDGGQEVEAGKIELQDPRVVVEILSPSTREIDEGVKLAEYQRVHSIRTIVLIDPVAETVLEWQSPGVGHWTARPVQPSTDLRFPDLRLAMPWTEIFARD